MQNRQSRVVRQVCKIEIAPGNEVVEHDHLVASLQQAVSEVTSDETGSAGDQHAHDRPIRLPQSDAP
jgi:hypothetical protein